jgi:hypothetical protein
MSLTTGGPERMEAARLSLVTLLRKCRVQASVCVVDAGAALNPRAGAGDFAARCAALGSLIAGSRREGLTVREDDENGQGSPSLLRIFSVPPPPISTEHEDADMRGYFDGLAALSPDHEPALYCRGVTPTIAIDL